MFGCRQNEFNALPFRIFEAARDFPLRDDTVRSRTTYDLFRCYA